MERKSNKKWYFLLGGLAAVLLLTSLLFLWPKPAPPAEELSTVSTKMNRPKSGGEMELVDDMVIRYSMAELSEKSSLILYGKVTEVHDSAVLHAPNVGLPITDVTVMPISVLRGSAEQPVTVRTFGGIINGEFSDYTDEPELFLNREYLFFLYQPAAGEGLNAEGDYYYTFGIQGTFEALTPATSDVPEATRAYNNSADNDVLFVSTEYLTPEGLLSTAALQESTQTTPESMEQMLSSDARPDHVVLSLNSMKEAYPQFNESHPIDLQWPLWQSLEAYENNLASGFISQEEYDRFMAELDDYAVVITPEEYAALPPDPETEAETQRLLDYLKQQESAQE